MNSSSLRYLIKEGFHNIWSNRMMSLASVAVLMSCLVMIGSAMMLFVNIESLLGRMEEENVVMAFVEDGTSDTDLDAVENELKAIDNVQSVDFQSKEEGWEEQLAAMDEADAAFFEGLSEEIPLPDGFRVTIADLSRFDETVQKIRAVNHVETVRENKELAEQLVSIRQGVSIISIVIVAVLFAISLFIISNTIRLTVYSRRLEISIMKSVGATNWFVRLPFIVEGVIIGVAAGVVSLFIVYGVYELVGAQMGNLFSALSITLVGFWNYALAMLAAFIGVGIVSGVGGSLIAMRKYLNKEGSEIGELF